MVEGGAATVPSQALNARRPLRESVAPLYCPSEVRILVIDDEEGICKLIQRGLVQPNFTIDTVSDVKEIEAKIRSKSYHLVILDYVIPGINIELVFEWLRRDQSEAGIIVMSGYPSVDGVVTCLRAKTYDYLTKPVDLEHLQEVVRRCLEGKGLLRLSEVALRESLGQTIRERRKTLGLTLAQMADRTNISLGYLSQIELGKNSASLESLYRICLSLGIRMAELFQAIKS
jgi:DNA-binding response OmpR family regulator